MNNSTTSQLTKRMFRVARFLSTHNGFSEIGRRALIYRAHFLRTIFREQGVS